MKIISNILLASIALVIAVSCTGKSGQAEAADTCATVLSVDSLLANAESLTDSLITVEGVCTHTCKHGATKMFLMGNDENNSIRVEACEIGSFAPEVVNNSVTVKGYLREQRIDEMYLSNWETMVDEDHSDACESERAARGVEAESAHGQIAEFRARIAEKVAAGGNPWLSFYYIDATEYEVNE